MDQKPETITLPLITRFKLWVASTLTNAGIRPDGTLDRRYRNLIDIKSTPNSTPVDGVSSYDVTVDPNRNLWYRIFIPDLPTGKLPVIVYFHGGGFAFFSPDSNPFDGLCRRLARMIPAVVVSVGYRLTPEHRFPAQYNDGIDILKFLDNDNRNDKKLPENADLRCCFLSGDSAGGNIAHHVCVTASRHTFRQLKVIGQVALQPFFGGEERTSSELSNQNSRGLALNHTDFYWNAFKPLDEEWDRDAPVINVSGPRAEDISGVDFPATLVVVGGRDILCDWQRRYYEWLKQSGKEAYLEEYVHMHHGFYVFQELAEATHVIFVIRDFVNNQMRI